MDSKESSDDPQDGYAWWCATCNPTPTKGAVRLHTHWSSARDEGLRQHQHRPIWLIYYKAGREHKIYSSDLDELVEFDIDLVAAFERNYGSTHPKTDEARRKAFHRMIEMGLMDEALRHFGPP